MLNGSCKITHQNKNIYDKSNSFLDYFIVAKISKHSLHNCY